VKKLRLHGRYIDRTIRCSILERDKRVFSFQNVLTGSGARPESWLEGLWFFPGIERPERDVDNCYVALRSRMV
jgi:hypothetical protein